MKAFSATFKASQSGAEPQFINATILARKVPGEDTFVLKGTCGYALDDPKNKPSFIRASDYRDAVKTFLGKEFYFCEIFDLFIREITL